MAIEFDEDGELDLSALTEKDIKNISEKVIKFLDDDQTAWYEKYGPFENLSLAEMGEEAMKAKLDAVDDALIWVHNDIDYGITISPIEGLDLDMNGSGWVLGREHYGGTEEIYAISKKPCTDGDSGPFFTYAQCLCPFCEDGEFNGEECTICLGAGDWGIDL